MKDFREEVDADARRRGLTRDRLSPGRVALLSVLLLVPAGVLLAAVHPAASTGVLAYVALSSFFCWGLMIKVGTS